MRKLDKIFLVVGFILLVYAIFSRFYGMPSVAMMRFRSLSFLILANMAFILSLIVKEK
jgi:hypothetical protein